MQPMNTERVFDQLAHLHHQADLADRPLLASLMAGLKNSTAALAQIAAGTDAANAGFYLAVSPAFGRFLYLSARARQASCIVEFGTSMGVSTLYLAAALRDNGGGRLIGSELDARKVACARLNLAAAGLADLVDVRAGDALVTLQEVDGPIDMVLLDGAFSQYLAILRLLEPHLAPGAVILAENAHDPDYRDYVRNPANGYVSHAACIDAGRATECTVRTG